MKKPFLVLIFLLLTLSLAAVIGTTKAQAATVQVTIYAGEITTSQYGFGNSSATITSPGPTLTFHSGDTVNVTLQNAGTMAHNWAIVDTKSSTGTVLWSAQIASSTNGVQVGQSESVTFTVGNSGNYYYICQVDGHVALGMWGNVVVESAIPEFPVPLMIVFLAAAITALVAYTGRLDFKHTIKF
jgi:plastocyanin